MIEARGRVSKYLFIIWRLRCSSRLEIASRIDLFVMIIYSRGNCSFEKTSMLWLSCSALLLEN